jgi:RNA polymerase sigma factor (sigma-70 family)
LYSTLPREDSGKEEGGEPSASEAVPAVKTSGGRQNSTQSANALFEQVWREHEPHLLKVCLRQLGDVSDAEDALASVSLTVLEKLPEVYGRVLSLRAWLVQVVLNYCVDVQRRRQRQVRIFVSEPTDDGDESWPAADTPTPEQQLLEQQLWAMAHSLIQRLPSMLREPADQYFLQKIPYPEIARSLGLRQDNVRKRIQKARAILWRELFPHLSE